MIKITGNIIDIVLSEIFYGNFLVDNGIIQSINKLGKPVLGEKFILPGFVDAHVHIESSMLVPSSFASVVIRHGTVAAISDPHEIANVLGEKGVCFMIENGKNSVLKFFWGVSSCVPSTLFEKSGAIIDCQLVNEMFSNFDFVCLSEVMNYPGVINNDNEVIEKLSIARKFNKKIDGHAPGLTGFFLKKYANAGVSTDHECISIQEAEEKIKCGIKIQIREGSSAKNFDKLFPLIDKYPFMVMLCCDDIHSEDLICGHINKLVAKGVAKGVDFFNIVRAATINPINHYGLDVGLLQNGDKADFIIVEDLISFNVSETWIDGRCVYRKGVQFNELVFTKYINNFLSYSVSLDDLKILNKFSNFRAIEVIDKELFTRSVVVQNIYKGLYLNSDVANNLLKIVVVNRYEKKKPAIGFVKNFGLKRGAIASSIAHDSHNIIAIGVDDQDILKAINLIMDSKGGISVVDRNDFLHLSLPVGGLMSLDSAEVVSKKYIQLDQMAKDLGTTLTSPFMTMSFLSLLVIPELKIGDCGLFDVMKFKLTDLFC